MNSKLEKEQQYYNDIENSDRDADEIDRAYLEQQIARGQLEPETMIEYQKYLVDPQAEQLYKELTKDYVISNLDKFELNYVRAVSDLVGHLDHLGLERAKKFFIRDAFIFLLSARSKGGFERRMQTTHTIKQNRSIERPQKGWRLF